MFHSTATRAILMCCRLALLCMLVFASIGNPAPAKANTAGPYTGLWLAHNMEGPEEPSMVVDKANGMHVVFSTLFSSQSSIYPVYYGYCPQNCADGASWSYLILGNKEMFGSGVTIAVTPNGGPRVMWYYNTLVGRKDIYFAECDASCGVPASWKVGKINTSYPFVYESPYLAVDPNGVAHYVYTDDYNDPHNGTFYTSCAANCTDPASWTEGKIDTGFAQMSDLKFDKAGNAHMLYFYKNSEDKDILTYVKCSAGTDCQDGNNWAGAALSTIGNDSFSDTLDFSLSLALTSSGAPRIATYLNKTLSYGWCNSDCSSSAANWSITGLGRPDNYGKYADIKLNSQNVPSIAYEAYAVDDNDGVNLSTCTSGCESASPVWSHTIVESTNQLDITDPVVKPPSCTVATWSESGMSISYVLDSGNQAHFVYGAKAIGWCNAKVSTLDYGVRFATAGGSGPVKDKLIFLPLLKK